MPVAGPDRGFGFRWFVPELARHRRIWRDVLVASFVVQLIALAVPLASQTIIDKVIVHRTPSTLAVIATHASAAQRLCRSIRTSALEDTRARSARAAAVT
mgnify:CR=1 FL=1